MELRRPIGAMEYENDICAKSYREIELIRGAKTKRLFVHEKKKSITGQGIDEERA